MPRQESAGSIREWVEDETTHVDVITSWEVLNDTYDMLRLTDPLSDAERLEEYKWIVQQVNSFLSKMRTRLLSCKDLDSMVECLAATMTPAGKVELSTRRALVYQKLRQQWVVTRLRTLQMMAEQEKEEEDGWTE